MEMLRDEELNFFSSGIERDEREKEKESNCVEGWASKFGDRSLTIGKKWIRILDTE